ncbi:MAG: DUF1559 domain-containing protein [Planctomycetaceae bacterium]|nr:DUF1559 domain-containing protein [Planctomycetaceae bacterium]
MTLVIVMVVTSLLIVEVGAARERARQGVCLSNMRQFGLALQDYESRSTRSTYPGYKSFQPMEDGSSFKAPSGPYSPYPLTMQGQDTAVSWIVELAPHIDSSRVKERPKWKASDKYLFPYIELIVCPSDPPLIVDRGPMSIVVNVGMRDGSTPGARDFRENGVFHDHFTDHPKQLSDLEPNPPFTTVNSAFIDRRGDGLQYTLMLSENVDAGSYLDTDERFLGFSWARPTEEVDFSGPVPTVNPPRNVCRINEGIGRQISPIESAGTHSSVGMQLRDSGHEDDDSQNFFYARPSSNHPGGVNVIFCDGHGQILSEKINYYVYIMLMTPKGNAVRDPHNQGALIDKPGFAQLEKPAPKFDERWLTQ